MRSPAIMSGVLLWALLAACAAPRADESGRVTEVIDGDTLKVALDGRTETVRLLGVDAPEVRHPEKGREPFGPEAAAELRGLALERVVRLERDPASDDRDAYGRLLRYVRLPDGSLLNGEIIARGYALALTAFPCSRAAELLALEREARSAGRGLWETARMPTSTAEDAARLAGSVARVCGTVASAKHARRVGGEPTFVDLDRPHPDAPFTILIWGADRAAFGEPETSWLGRRVCVIGEVQLHKGKPQTIARDPSQVEIVP